MKKVVFSILMGVLLPVAALAQGRVVINEYMPWTSNGCGATAEFVELLNFGPGPIDIGCYVLTDGDYSVTIPAGTILQPGEFYVLAGQDFIPAPCANIDSAITVDLNWNTCGCTSAPIPTTGDGFFTDGGSANEQVVLLSPTGQVVDAVIRDLPAESSSTIMTAPIGGCAPFTFNLAEMTVNYEVLGMSTGRGNSFARKLDGDCGWVKDPQQSANATNNTPGDVSDISYEFTYLTAEDCSSNRGSINVTVKRSDYTSVFPMRYTLAFDSDYDNLFTFNDTYSTYIDYTPPDMTISGLPAGRYRLTVESAKGCYLHVFNFSILPCYPVLPVRLRYFRYSGSQALEWQIEEEGELQSVVLEGAPANGRFTELRRWGHGGGHFRYSLPTAALEQYRLKLNLRSGGSFYSPVLTRGGPAFTGEGVAPNPVSQTLTLTLGAAAAEERDYRILNAAGQPVRSGRLRLQPGHNRLPLDVSALPPGLYGILLPGAEPRVFRFVKH